MATESPLKVMKTAFLPLKFFLFTRYLNYCLDFLIIQKKGFRRKIRLISKFMTLQPEKETIVIHVLPNISRSIDNQKIKFGQLIKKNMRIIFQDVVEKLFTDPFLKNSKLSISLNRLSKVLYILFLFYPKLSAFEDLLLKQIKHVF